MTTNEDIKVLVQENNHEVYMLSAAMNELEAIQFAVSRLMNDVDEGVFKRILQNSRHGTVVY